MTDQPTIPEYSEYNADMQLMGEARARERRGGLGLPGRGVTPPDQPTIPDAAVEAAARAAYASDYRAPTDPLWDLLSVVDADSYRVYVRKILAAAYPLLAAQVLREAANVLKICLKCGKIHEYRLISQPGALVERRSWADPDDGHDYRPTTPWHRDDIAPWLEARADELESTP